MLVTLGAIAAWDFIYYWNHRFMHESRWLWAIHVVHHSSERYNLSTALRQPVAEHFGAMLPYGLLSLAGVRPSIVETARGVNLLYQYWIHTEAIDRLGVAEEVLNTASHHRVHHGSNPQYLDRNHGSILIVWDRLFGTFAREEEPVVYGLTRNIDTFDPVRIATHEHVEMFRDVARAVTWRDRLSHVFRGPGWSYARRAEREAPSLRCRRDSAHPGDVVAGFVDGRSALVVADVALHDHGLGVDVDGQVVDGGELGELGLDGGLAVVAGDAGDGVGADGHGDLRNAGV